MLAIGLPHRSPLEYATNHRTFRRQLTYRSTRRHHARRVHRARISRLPIFIGCWSASFGVSAAARDGVRTAGGAAALTTRLAEKLINVGCRVVDSVKPTAAEGSAATIAVGDAVHSGTSTGCGVAIAVDEAAAATRLHGTGPVAARPVASEPRCWSADLEEGGRVDRPRRATALRLSPHVARNHLVDQVACPRRSSRLTVSSQV